MDPLLRDTLTGLFRLGVRAAASAAESVLDDADHALTEGRLRIAKAKTTTRVIKERTRRRLERDGGGDPYS